MIFVRSKNSIHDMLFFLFITFLSLHATDGNLGQTILSYAYSFGGVLLYMKRLSIKQPIFLYTVGWVCFVLLSSIWAQNKTDAYAYNAHLIKLMMITLVLSNRIKSYQDLMRILKLFVWARIICAIVLIVKTPLHHWGTLQIGSAIGMWKNDVGISFFLSAAMAWALYVGDRQYKSLGEHIIYLIAFIVFLVISMLSGSRKVVVMLAMFIMAYKFLSEKSKLTRKVIFKRFGQICFVVAALVLLYVLIMKIPMLYNTMGRRIETMFHYAQIKSGDESAEERNFFISKAIELWRQHPLIGAGANGFVTYMRQIMYSHIAYSHNNFTEMLCTTGIVGFLLYYVYPVRTLFFQSPFHMEDGRIRKVSVSLWIVLAIFIICGYWFVYYFDILYSFAIILPCIAAKVAAEYSSHIMED